MNGFVFALVFGAAPLEVHPDMTAVLQEYAKAGMGEIFDLSPEDAQAMINQYAPPPVDLEIARIRDMILDTPTRAIPARLYHPAPGTVLPLLVWYHGGGWTWGTLDQADSDVRFIADRGRLAVLTIDYRLAPQHRFPEGVMDAVAAATWAIEHADELDVDAARIAVGGDSAGGNLAAVTALVLRDKAVTPPLAAQFLVYPVLDTDLDRPSMHQFAKGYGLERHMMPWFLDLYAPDHDDWTDWRIAPIRAESHSGLPHAIILAAQVDIVRDEAVAYAATLAQDGVAVDLTVAAGMIHGFTAYWGESDAVRREFGFGVDRLASILQGAAPDPMQAFTALLDVDANGRISPLEAADALMRVTAETDSTELRLRDIAGVLRQQHESMLGELHDTMHELDLDEDGRVELAELDEGFRPLGHRLDLDGDGVLQEAELRPIIEHPHDVFIRMEVELVLDGFEATGSGRVELVDAHDDPELREWLEEVDVDDDGFATRQELHAWLTHADASLRFDIDGHTAIATGTIDESTPARVMELILMDPEVDTIILLDVPGSVDDDSNLIAARFLRAHGFTTVVPADGIIASGGVDLFLAGAQRRIKPGARVGVHSWGTFGYSGSDVPADHEDHEMYLDYCREMGIPEAFYWFTLNAAGPDDIHWMTPDELERFGCITHDAVPDGAPAARKPAAVGSGPLGISPIGDDAQRERREGFTKYTEVIAPNGRPIRIVAQPGVPDIAVARARNLLRFFLTDVPGSQYGQDKSAVANAMADNGALLMMPEGHHRPGREPRLEAQPLFEDEAPVDGSRWYLSNNWDHRDAGFEEIFHLVHDTGIGTYMPGALPEYQRALDTEARAAIRDGRWGIPVEPDVAEWLEELEEEDSLAQEYIASVIDSYYGLWAAFDERPGGMWGTYCAKTRDEMARKDPRGMALLEAFLGPKMHGYEALIDPSFSGTFWMEYHPDRAYTHKSRWYVDARLTGKKDSGLRGNDADNHLAGNAGDNTLRGGAGTDTAVFSGPRRDYDITRSGHVLIVTDTRSDRDGTDTLVEIDRLQFADGVVPAPMD